MLKYMACSVGNVQNVIGNPTPRPGFVRGKEAITRQPVKCTGPPRARSGRDYTSCTPPGATGSQSSERNYIFVGHWNMLSILFRNVKYFIILTLEM